MDLRNRGATQGCFNSRASHVSSWSAPLSKRSKPFNFGKRSRKLNGYKATGNGLAQTVLYCMCRTIRNAEIDHDDEAGVLEITDNQLKLSRELNNCTTTTMSYERSRIPGSKRNTHWDFVFESLINVNSMCAFSSSPMPRIHGRLKSTRWSSRCKSKFIFLMR